MINSEDTNYFRRRVAHLRSVTVTRTSRDPGKWSISANFCYFNHPTLLSQRKSQAGKFDFKSEISLEFRGHQLPLVLLVFGFSGLRADDRSFHSAAAWGRRRRPVTSCGVRHQTVDRAHETGKIKIKYLGQPVTRRLIGFLPIATAATRFSQQPKNKCRILFDISTFWLGKFEFTVKFQVIFEWIILYLNKLKVNFPFKSQAAAQKRLMMTLKWWWLRWWWRSGKQRDHWQRCSFWSLTF